MRPLELLFVVSPVFLLHDAVLAGAEQATTRKPEEKRDKVGLALSGGSITAANICGSVMRGFQQQKVTIDGEERPALDAFDYTSALSGGNFPNLMYAFAPDTTSDEILDADGINDPTQITAEALQTVPEKSMFALFTETILFSVLRAVTGTFVHGWDFWTQVVYYHFLEPLGIPANMQMGTDVKQREDAKATPVVEFSMTGPPELYSDWLYEHMSRGVATDLKEGGASEPSIEMPPEYINAVRASAAMAMETFEIELPPGYDDFYQISPDAVLDALQKHNYQVPVPYFSTPEQFSTSFTAGRMEFDPTANKTAEPLDFAPFVASATDSDGGLFSLERLLAFGTALVPIFTNPSGMGAIFPAELIDLIGDPLTLKVPTADGDKRNMSFADGGYNDATGIPALVKLKVRKIVSVLLTTGQGLSTSKDPLFWPVNSMKPFFGVVDRSLQLNPDSFTVCGEFGNHIFDLYSNGENQLSKLEAIIKKQHEAGNPLIATLENLDVVDNPFWDTEAGEQVDLTLIFSLGVPKRFSDQIPRDAAPPAENKPFIENGFFTNLDLSFAPNSLSQRNLVIGEDIKDEDGNVIIPLEKEIEIPLEFKLGVEETRMTNFLMSWVVKDAWNGLEDVDGNIIFDGFKNILDPEPKGLVEEPMGEGPETMSSGSEDESSGGAQWFLCSYIGVLVGGFAFGAVSWIA